MIVERVANKLSEFPQNVSGLASRRISVIVLGSSG
jgi:hypothetical protein